LILVGALFLLDGGRRREGKKKKRRQKIEITMGKEGLLEAGPALLAVQWVIAVRYN
jgi:hypothetical protein